MEEVSIIGLDLAKNVFQLHGARSDGSVAFPPNSLAIKASVILRCDTALSGRHGGLRKRASLGSANRWSRAPSAADRADLREALRKAK